VVVELPCRTDVPAYDFEIDLDDRSFLLVFHWNDRAAAWFFSITSADGDLLVAGRRVVVDFPLLSRFRDNRLPSGEIVAVDTSGEQRNPGIADLGARVKLLYFAAEDLPAAFVG